MADNIHSALTPRGSVLIKNLYVMHWSELCHYLRGRFSDGNIDAEDIVQLTFTRFAGLADPESIKNPRAFLFATAKNIAIDEFRKSKTRSAHQQRMEQTAEVKINDDFSPENVLLKRQKLDLTAAAIKKLPNRERSVLLMHRIDKLTYTQIASKTGMSETSVRRYVKKAIARVHKEIKNAVE